MISMRQKHAAEHALKSIKRMLIIRVKHEAHVPKNTSKVSK
jgi:hypothetical protein